MPTLGARLVTAIAVAGVALAVGAAGAAAAPVKVYFTHDGAGSSCDRVIAVRREVRPPGVLRGAMTMLLRGPTAAERSHGYGGWFTRRTAGMLNGVAVRAGVARIDFGDLRAIIPNASTSCGATTLLAQLNRTVRQFRSISHAVYSIGGSTAAFYHWLQMEVPGADARAARLRPPPQAPTCSHGQLRVTAGPVQGAAGTLGAALRFRNVSPVACSLRGYPGVSSVSAEHGHRIGRPADRDPSERVRRVRLAARGGAASALYLQTDVGVLDRAACRPVSARGLRIYPPGHTRWFYVRLRHRTCSTGPGVSRVRAVVAGVTGLSAGVGQRRVKPRRFSVRAWWRPSPRAAANGHDRPPDAVRGDGMSARRSVVPLVASAILLAAPGAARADAPATARIVEGRSMAGVALGSAATVADDGMSIVQSPLATWGPVDGFCFEGSNCAWPGVLVVVARSRVWRISTRKSGWRTSRGIGPKATVGRLRRAYGRRIVRRSTCGLNGFGGDSDGYVLSTRVAGERRFTYFELASSGSRVKAVWIGRGRLPPPPGAGC